MSLSSPASVQSNDQPQGMTLRATELLMSRLCHDLISPVGAVYNGVELLEEGDPSFLKDAADLIGRSAKSASRKLQVYRLAYGTAGGIASLSLTDIRQLLVDFASEYKTELSWHLPPIAMDSKPTRESMKVFINSVILAVESLPRGGEIDVALDAQGDKFDMMITASGTSAGIEPIVQRALSGDVDIADLEPKTIHGYYLKCLADAAPTHLAAITTSADRIQIQALLPADIL